MGISKGTIDCIKKGRFISLYTVDRLCKLLDCEISDIVKYNK
ncbi:MAG: helix-turn-helix transcriptional regulator [Erysipelotrichaceae bacterium]|nr:helix-turn-helix transcriptional regulator [Erysipelotrichaceae bacterium]